ncbi:hypothetical protein PGQ11_011030 [Apiospora arundinis]|uniref:F-box domain-containing protein n=1 Tax=Apiospora arundinis TaxID=335852 RepID=A0ABR2HYB9_9PEZI
MSGTRRSARLQRIGSVQPPAPASTASTQQITKSSTPAPPKKRKTTPAQTTVKKPVKPKAKAVPLIPAASYPADDCLTSLPPELLNLVLGNINKGDRPTLSALARTSKALYSMITPRLYARVAVHASYHAHIAKLIRTLEPLLTIAQKRQLKKEGKYKGQQERYPTTLDPNFKPICTQYVGQLIVGRVDPGRKHRYIVDRYVEEAFKNLDNLAIVETRVLTRSIIQSLAAAKHLKALAVLGEGLEGCAGEDEAMLKPFSKIKGLRHLSLETLGWTYTTSKETVAYALLRNSASTLQTLRLSTGSPGTQFFLGGEDQAKTLPPLAQLRSFEIQGIELGEGGKTVDGMLACVDFVKLHRLLIERLYNWRGGKEHAARFFDRLAVLFAEASQTAAAPSLRTLHLRLSKQPDAEARFIASFGTLTELLLPDHASYPIGGQDPGLSSAMLDAILKHTKLRTLMLSCQGIVSGTAVPHLSIPTIRALVQGLPELRELQFVFNHENVTNVARELAGARNLACFKIGWGGGSHGDPETIEAFIKAYLDSDAIDSAKTGAEFCWENHYSLSRLEGNMAYEITSKPGKPSKLYRLVRGNVCEGRSVWIKELPNKWSKEDWYGPSSEWVDMVEKDLD